MKKVDYRHGVNTTLDNNHALTTTTKCTKMNNVKHQCITVQTALVNQPHQ